MHSSTMPSRKGRCRSSTFVCRSLPSLLAVAVAAAMMGRAPGGPAAEGVKDLDVFLDELYRYGLKNNMWNVRPADGRFLQLMTAATGAKRVLELGTANGYSGIWMLRSLKEGGGKLTTVEISEVKAREARTNFEKAGLAEFADVKVGDVAKLLPTLEGPFDLIFLDTEKQAYLDHLKLALPLLKPGGVLLAHNVILMKDSMAEFLQTIETHPQLITSIVQTSDDGFSVSYRKK